MNAWEGPNQIPKWTGPKFIRSSVNEALVQSLGFHSKTKGLSYSSDSSKISIFEGFYCKMLKFSLY